MKIAHIGFASNGCYFSAWAVKKFYDIESMLFMPCNPTSIAKKTLYGYDCGNPYGLNIIYFDHLIGCIPHVVRALIQERVDIVHVHSGGIIDSLKTKLCKAKVIFHFHGSDLRRWLIVDTWRRMYYYSRLAGEDKILVTTPDLLKFLTWKDALKKAEYMPNPIDPAFYEEKIGDEGEPTIFLPTRHDEDIKRTSVAFEAWKILRKLNQRVRLKTIMWGKDSPAFYEKFKDDKRITWLPVLSRVDYIKQLKSSSIVWGQFVLGTHGFIELEAMGAAKPVFHYWKRDFYSRGVYDQLPPFRSYHSSESIANATNDLCEDTRKRRKIGLQLQRWVLNYHSPKNVSKRLYRVYREIL